MDGKTGGVVGGQHDKQSCARVHGMSHILLTWVGKGRSDRLTFVSFWWERTWCRSVDGELEGKVWTDWISRIMSLSLVRWCFREDAWPKESLVRTSRLSMCWSVDCIAMDWYGHGKGGR